MSDQSEIEPAMRTAFFQAFPAAANITALANVKFDPAEKPMWFELHHMPGKSRVASLGKSGQDEFPGYTQIDVNLPAGKGLDGVPDFVKAMGLRFTAGARCQYGSTSLTVGTFYQNGPGREADGFYKISFIITWEARITRNN